MKKNVPHRVRLCFSLLFFTAVCLAFAGICGFSFPLKVQFFPSWDRKAWAVVGTILAVTVLFGRFYCAVLCPFGILQDFIGFLSRRKARPDANRPLLRYAIAGLSAAAFSAGSVTVFAFFDPYSNFGRLAAFFKNPQFLWGGAVLVVITGLSVWKKRIFCTSICPVGTLLGLCAKIGVFKMRFSDKCIKCRKCVTVCPAACLSPSDGILDNERCVRCLNCTAVCPVGAVGFFKKSSDTVSPTDFSKRAFLTGALTTATAVGAGAVLASSVPLRSAERVICPPGATTFENFASKCTNCLLCASVCPARVIRPDGVNGVVRLVYGERYCRYDCNACSTVCPTGALNPLTIAAKQRCRIGMAQFFKDRCVGCGKCVAACPQGAVELKTFDDKLKAVLKPLYCIGCGACVAACPLSDKAVRVVPVAVQGEALKGEK